MDDADRTDDLIVSVIDIAVRHASENLVDLNSIESNQCLWCGKEQSEEHRRWCDADCRDEWEKECSRK